MANFLKRKMKDGNAVFGTWCMLPSSFVVDVVAQTGLDFIVLDMEHGALSWETAEEMVRAAQLHNCQPIIRVGDDQENTILHALETGCGAIMVPHVSTAEAAKKIVNAALYSPKGTRGLSPYTRCHGYTHFELDKSIKLHSKETLVGILVEGKEGIDNLDEIADVPGIDLIYLGLYDISQSLGLAGQLEHPKVKKQLDICLNKILKHNKFAGTFSRDIEASVEFKKKGFQFVAYVADSYALTSFYSNATKKYNTE
jgi:4-hydroxy-2-oxoheptanedioate aldolase